MSGTRPTPDTASRAAAPAAPAGPNPPPTDTGRGDDDDGLLGSIGKAITAPVRGAAEPEEPKRDGPDVAVSRE